MACGLKVLMNVKEDLEEKFTEGEITSLRTPEGKAEHQEALREIYDDRCRKVNSEGEYDGRLYGSVTYFKDTYPSFEKSEESEGYGFGATKPDQIREEILSWNRRNSMACIRLLGEFEKLAVQQGFGTLSEMFAAQIRKDGRIQDDAFRYPASLYELRKALDCVDGVFTYGQDFLVFDDTEGINPYVTADMMARAEEHPEDFLILGVYYD